jgi:ubiquitin-protein ligase
MTSNARLINEFKSFEKQRMDNVTFDVDENNILEWKFTLLGPQDSPYEGGIYNGIITFLCH